MFGREGHVGGKQKQPRGEEKDLHPDGTPCLSNTLRENIRLSLDGKHTYSIVDANIANIVVLVCSDSKSLAITGNTNNFVGLYDIDYTHKENIAQLPLEANPAFLSMLSSLLER